MWVPALMVTIAGFTLMALSSTSWFMVWISMEGALVVSCAMLLSSPSPANSESVSLYFVTQLLSGVLILWGALAPSSAVLVILLGAALKLGLVPFHWWVPPVYRGVSYFAVFLLSTILKIQGFVVLSYVWGSWALVLAIVSVYYASLMGSQLSSVKKILAWSSVQQTGWVVFILASPVRWMYVYLIYTFMVWSLCVWLDWLSIASVAQLEHLHSWDALALSTILVSMSGLPPFLGFALKWGVVYWVSQELGGLLLLITPAFVFSLYFYLSLTLMALSKASWSFTNPNTSSWLIGFMLLNLVALPF